MFKEAQEDEKEQDKMGGGSVRGAEGGIRDGAIFIQHNAQKIIQAGGQYLSNMKT